MKLTRFHRRCWRKKRRGDSSCSSISIWKTATAGLPRNVGTDVAAPFVLLKIAAGAKTKSGDQLLLVNELELDGAVAAAAAAARR